MKLTQLRLRPNAPPIIEVERDFLFASMMLAHIERLPKTVVLSKRSWAMADSFEAFFEYRGFRFFMGIPFGGIMIVAQKPDTPREMIDEIAAHIDRYHTVWPTKLLWAMARYFFLPYSLDEQRPA